jgi:heme-degrading monooxygenase HmoA
MMHARVTTFHAQPGKIDEGIRIFEESVIPQLKEVKGFVSTQLLIDRLANTVMGVTLYETLADLEAGTTLFRQMLATPSSTAILAGPPVVAVYEVAAQAAMER